MTEHEKIKAFFAVAESVAEGLQSVALQVKYLGGGDNSDERGAVEFLGIQLEEGCERIASAIETLAVAIDNHGAAEA